MRAWKDLGYLQARSERPNVSHVSPSTATARTRRPRDTLRRRLNHAPRPIQRLRNRERREDMRRVHKQRSLREVPPRADPRAEAKDLRWVRHVRVELALGSEEAFGLERLGVWVALFVVEDRPA